MSEESILQAIFSYISKKVIRKCVSMLDEIRDGDKDEKRKIVTMGKIDSRYVSTNRANYLQTTDGH